MTSTSLLQNPPLSLYVHIPWCIRKCPYCDFNSHEVKSGVPEKQYVDQLIRDLEIELPGVWGRRLHSIFIGGGTPSLFSASSIERLLSEVRALLPFEHNIEITMEANPGTFEKEKFIDFREAGVNRLSIGVQSFNDSHLEKLGRVHSAEQALAAAQCAREAGYQSFNLDLMHGLPDQSVEQAMTDLEQALELAPDHISWYQLTLEPNTLFYQRPPKLPKDEILWDIQEQGSGRLKAAGFGQYEVSAFATSEKLRSRHNQNYWEFGDYLGIGAGAHGKITRLDLGKVLRTQRKRHPKNYLAETISELRSEQEISHTQIAFEFMLNALRLKNGVPRQYFSERTGLPESAIGNALAKAIRAGLLSDSSDSFAATENGFLFLNELLEIFMDAEHEAIEITQI